MGTHNKRPSPSGTDLWANFLAPGTVPRSPPGPPAVFERRLEHRVFELQRHVENRFTAGISPQVTSILTQELQSASKIFKDSICGNTRPCVPRETHDAASTTTTRSRTPSCTHLVFCGKGGLAPQQLGPLDFRDCDDQHTSLLDLPVSIDG